MTTPRTDPFRNFNFMIEIDGIVQGSFTECSGLEDTTEVIEFRQGGDSTTVYKLPGKTSYGDITLKWGTTASTELMVWRQEVVEGNVIRRNGSVVLYDLANQNEVARWHFFNAWPSKWDGPALNAKGNDISIETLVLAVERLTRG
jgi:phage tail-like protein